MRIVVERILNILMHYYKHEHSCLHAAVMRMTPCLVLTYEFYNLNGPVVSLPGNHACVAVINNHIPKSDIDYYTMPQGLETEPKLPAILVAPLHKFVMQVSL
jgi:hypothetical protein